MAEPTEAEQLEELTRKAAEKRAAGQRVAGSSTTSSKGERCPACGERPAKRVGEGPFALLAPCDPCRDAATSEDESRKRLDRERRAKERRDKVESVMQSAGVNVRKYGGATLETFNPDPDRAALDRAREFVAAFMRGERPSLYLFSERPGERLAPGNGKTHLAVGILREVVLEVVTRPSDVRFAFVPEMLLEIQDTFDNPQSSMLDVVKRYSEPELLVWDDFGAEKLSDFAVRTLYTILYKREGRSNIFTSNLTLDAVESRDAYAERITSRIAGDARLVRLRGPDRRVRRVA